MDYMEMLGTTNVTSNCSEVTTEISAGKLFLAYFTPVLLFVGLVGNGLSLAVFLSKNMRKLSASSYLAALSTADIATLVFYVFPEWLRRGLVNLAPDVDLSFLDTNGVCQVMLYCSYISRLMSSWLIVIFTIERYIGVCHPLKSYARGNKRIILFLFIVSCALVLYKPLLSGVYTERGRTYCSRNLNFQKLNFVLDTVFAVLITLIPFIVITVLNFLIVRKLFLRMIRHKDLISEETNIRLEFTLILLAISIFFVVFNLPYFAIWSRNFWHYQFLHSHTTVNSDIKYWNDVLTFTRPVFYMNYCVNFFLYSITGAYFRRELKSLCTCGLARRNNSYNAYLHYSRQGSGNTQLTTYTNGQCPKTMSTTT